MIPKSFYDNWHPKCGDAVVGLSTGRTYLIDKVLGDELTLSTRGHITGTVEKLACVPVGQYVPWIAGNENIAPVHKDTVVTVWLGDKITASDHTCLASEWCGANDAEGTIDGFMVYAGNVDPVVSAGSKDKKQNDFLTSVIKGFDGNATKASEIQIGGNHYKERDGKKIPFDVAEFCEGRNYTPLQAMICKYNDRIFDKGDMAENAKKLIHCALLMLEYHPDGKR